MAQFNHPELGGMGQWSGGMVMIGEFSNTGLKHRVNSACIDLAAGVSRTLSNPHSEHVSNNGEKSNWWPTDLGHAASTGAQNDSHYAYFPSSRRLAIKHGGIVTIYDTGDHQIFGAAQQQGKSHSLTFESQNGAVDISSLKVIQ